MTIDYSKLNDRIVEQASMVLTEEQRQRLFQNKVDRAQAMIQSRDQIKPLTVYHTIED